MEYQGNPQLQIPQYNGGLLEADPLRERRAVTEKGDSLLKLFDNDNYETREAASREMAALGKAAEPALRRAMKESPSVEVRIRARRLREEILEKPRAALSGHTGDVEGLAFSPDGRVLASGGTDGTVRLWDVKERKQVIQLVAVAP